MAFGPVESVFLIRVFANCKRKKLGNCKAVREEGRRLVMRALQKFSS